MPLTRSSAHRSHDWLVSALPSAPGDVLDVMCGSAPLHPRFTMASSYLGVDLSRAELDEARRRVRGPVVHGDARDLPVEDASMDTVVSAMGLMLVQPLADAVAEIGRVLRPGGHAAFLRPSITPLRTSDLPPLLTLVRHLGRPGSMPQLVTSRRLSALLDAVGLRVTRTSRHWFAFPVPTREHARLAVSALYTPARTPGRLAAAEGALGRWTGPGRCSSRCH